MHDLQLGIVKIRERGKQKNRIIELTYGSERVEKQTKQSTDHESFITNSVRSNKESFLLSIEKNKQLKYPNKK